MIISVEDFIWSRVEEKPSSRARCCEQHNLRTDSVLVASQLAFLQLLNTADNVARLCRPLGDATVSQSSLSFVTVNASPLIPKHQHVIKVFGQQIPPAAAAPAAAPP